MGPGKINPSTKVTCMCGKVKDKNRYKKRKRKRKKKHRKGQESYAVVTRQSHRYKIHI